MPLMREHVEDHLVPGRCAISLRRGCRACAIRPPWAMLASIVAERRRAARTSRGRRRSPPSCRARCCTSARSRRAGRRRASRPSPRELEPVGVGVGDDDVARAGVADDRGRHAADRAGAGDEHVLAEHRGTAAPCARRCRTDRRSPRPRSSMPGQWCQTLVIGSEMYSANAPGRLTPTPIVWRAQVAAAGHAVAAASADDVPLAADEVARAEVVHVRADLDDLADELVPDHHRHRDRLLRPRVPARRCGRRCRRSRSCARGSGRR